MNFHSDGRFYIYHRNNVTNNQIPFKFYRIQDMDEPTHTYVLDQYGHRAGQHIFSVDWDSNFAHLFLFGSFDNYWLHSMNLETHARTQRTFRVQGEKINEYVSLSYILLKQYIFDCCSILRDTKHGIKTRCFTRQSTKTVSIMCLHSI